MIKHIVFWNLVNKTQPIDANEDAIEIKKALEGLLTKIPGLLHIEVGFDYSNNDSSHDIVLYSEFESKQSLSDYIINPAHVAAGKIVRPRTKDRTMVDVETYD